MTEKTSSKKTAKKKTTKVEKKKTKKTKRKTRSTRDLITEIQEEHNPFEVIFVLLAWLVHFAPEKAEELIEIARFEGAKLRIKRMLE